MMGFGIFGLIFMVLAWGVLIGMVLWVASNLFPQVGRHPTTTNGHLTAQQIVEMRYARGEITREQYELMRQDLK
jgi:uncharacterized membrane protein